MKAPGHSDGNARMTELDRGREEIERGERFAFGANWLRFLETVDDARIAAATADLQRMLGDGPLEGLRFLDIGSGSGLSSLVARKLGAVVQSFDYDTQSVACTVEMRRRYRPDDPDWTVEQGSALDAAFMERMPPADIVYSWGVLHHTGDLWTAMDLAIAKVAPGGRFFIALYNDQGGASRRWRWVKKAYVSGGRPTRLVLTFYTLVRTWGLTVLRDTMRGNPLRTWRQSGKTRGMSPWHDVVDWVGGYPFEVAKPEEVLDFCRARGFELRRLSTCLGGHGCNEFVFERVT